MDSKEWRKISRVITQVLTLPHDSRIEKIKELCNDDSALIDEVQSLLNSIENSDDFLNNQRNKKNALFQELEDALERNPDTEDFFTGKTLGRWTLTELLGRGGMGSVYKAERTDEDGIRQVVALKIIHKSLVTPLNLERFKLEQQILAGIRHPNIAGFIDSGVTPDGIPYMVMEFAEGETIIEYCNNRSFSIEKRLQLFGIVCKAVQYAHKNLIVHRDLKPENIIVSDEGHVTILDFGIAKLLDPNIYEHTSVQTQPGTRLMSLEYASPEQISGAAVTTSSDVYALGVLLYKLLTNRHPFDFDDHSFREIETIILQKEPTKPSTQTSIIESKKIGLTPNRLKKRLSGDLDNIILKSLAKDPEERYGTVEKLVEDIQKHQAGLPVDASAATVHYRVRKFVARHKGSVSAAAAITLTLIVALSVSLWQANVAATERDRARHEAEKSQQTADFLVDLFEGTDPFESQQESMTTDELLTRGEEKIKLELSDQPDLRAQVLMVLGRVYRRMARYQESENVLRQSIELREATLGTQHMDTGDSKFELASLYRDWGQPGRADSLLNEVLTLQRNHFGSAHPKIAMTLEMHAGVWMDQGDYDKAENGYREALEVIQLFPDQVATTSTIMSNLAIVLEQKGDLEESEQWYRYALEAGRSELGFEHPAVIGINYSLGHLIYRKGDLITADSIYQETLTGFRRAYGEEHPNVAFILNARGSLLHDLGKYDEAEQQYLEALAIYRKILPETHSYIIYVLNNYGILLLEGRNDLKAAENLYREILALQRQSLPSDHPDLGLRMHNLGVVLYRQERYDEAESSLREAISIFEQSLPKDHLWPARSRIRLAQTLASQNNFEIAEPFYIAGFETLREHYGDENDEVIITKDDLSNFYQEWGKPDDAAEYASDIETPDEL